MRYFHTSHSPATVSFGHGTLIFESSVSKIGGYHSFSKSHTHLAEKVQKRPKQAPVLHQIDHYHPPPPPTNCGPRTNAHIYESCLCLVCLACLPAPNHNHT